MQSVNQTACVIEYNEASAAEELKRLAFFAIMELSEEEKITVLSKYAERYGFAL